MNRYPSEEELNAFIEALEEQELYAPKNMKAEILNKAFHQQTEAALPQSKSQHAVDSRKARVALFTYRLKIVAGMAAALFMLVLIPMQNKGFNAGEPVPTEQVQENVRTEKKKNSDSVDVTRVLNESTRKVNEKMNHWTEKMNHLFEFNYGGNENEN